MKYRFQFLPAAMRYLTLRRRTPSAPSGRLMFCVLVTAASLYAQDTLPLRPITPRVDIVNARSAGPPATVTTAPGSVTFKIGDASGTFSIEAPATISGVLKGLWYDLNPQPTITLKLTLNGLRSAEAHFFDSGGCQVWGGPGYVNARASAECTLPRIESQTTDAGEPGVRIYTVVSVASGNSNLEYSVYFWWATAPAAELDLFPYFQILQVTQTVRGDVPLIAGKNTIVRVFARHRGSVAPVQQITAKLHAWTLDGKDGNRVTPLRDADVPRGFISSSDVPDVDNPAASLIFKNLPPTWTSAPFLEIEAELVPPPNAQVSQAASLKISRKVAFMPSSPLRVIWFPISYIDTKGVKQQAPTTDLPNVGDLLKKIYPLKESQVDIKKIAVGDVYSKLRNGVVWSKPLDIGENQDELKSAVARLTKHEKFPPHDMTFALLPAIVSKDTDDVMGSADPPYHGGKGKSLWVVQREDIRKLQKTLAHEIGHNLGLRHTNTDDSKFDAECGFAPDATTDWTKEFGYTNGSIQEPGFDTIQNVFKSRKLFDLMAYCPADKTWIAPEHYRQLFNNRPQPPAAANSKDPSPLSRRDAQSAEYWIVNGRVDQDGSGGQLEPALRVSSTEPADNSDPNGSHCLVVTGSSGTSKFCFTPVFRNAEEVPLDSKYFSFQIPYVAGATRLALVSGDRELTALTGGSSPPVVSITSPQNGDQLSGTASVSWNATDPSGLPLSYFFDYSSDGGNTWFPITIEPLTDPHVDIDTAQLVGGSQVMFRVMALNGLETTTATVGPLNIPQTPQLAQDATVDFGDVFMGETYSANLSLSNSGTGPYTINAISIDNPDFQVSLNPPVYVWPGDTALKIPISFRPSAAGPVKAILTIDGGATVTLMARVTNAATPMISVSPKSLNFGTVTIGQSPTTMKFIITNTGQADLHVNSITPTGNPSFSLVPAFAPVTLAAGKSTEITVQFAPTAAGPVSGSLSIASDDPANPTVNISLSGAATGTGGGTAPAISVTPTSIDFGSVNVGASQTKTVTISNNGNAALNVTSLTAAAPFSVVSPTAPLSVAAGASSTVTVKFAPTTAGAQTGTLAIASNDAAKPSVTVVLTGTGVGGSPESGNIIRTFGYHEITRFSKEVRFSNGGMPVLSAGGGRVVYAHAPGDETDARYTHIFVMNADGSGQREVDVYKQNCGCGAIVDISADGSTVISSDSIELRAASATGSTGRRLITNREIPYARISPRGDKVFFIHRRGEASATDATTERGLYVINIDGSGLKQVAGPKAVASLLGTTADKVFPFATTGWSLDVSADGTKLVFGVAAPGGERILAVNADGTGLRQVLGPVDFVSHVALSGDGARVGYDVIRPPCCSSPNEVGVVNADGNNRKVLATRTPDVGGGRIQMSGDGTQLLVGNTSYLYAADGSGVVQLSARGGFYSTDRAPLVTDGFGLPSMNSLATRFLYIVKDDAGIAQLAILDINPAGLGDAPSITAPALTQATLALNGGGQSLVSASVATSNTINRVSAAVLNAGIFDANVNAPVMLDDGTNGDQVAGDGIYTGRIPAPCCAALGPRTVRVKAEVRDSGDRRHATVIEFGGLTVVSSVP